MSLKCLTSPGINGLRNDHLKALWGYSDLDEIDDDVNSFRKAYYSFICMMFQPHNETGDLWRLENMVKLQNERWHIAGRSNVYAVVLHLHYANDQRHR